jgi:hypothetical protein
MDTQNRHHERAHKEKTDKDYIEEVFPKGLWANPRCSQAI